MDDISFCPHECNVIGCFRNKENIADKTVPHSYFQETPPDCMKENYLTIKEIAKKYDLEYFVVYCALDEAGLLKRRGKNVQYNEIGTLGAVMRYLTARLDKYKRRCYSFLDMMEQIDDALKNKLQKQGK